MDLTVIVGTEQPENRHLAYVSKAADPAQIVEQLVGMANAEGGTVVVGVRADEDGVPSRIEDVGARDELIAAVDRVATEHVESALEYRTERFEVGGKRLLGVTTAPRERLRSYRTECCEKPMFPVRRRAELEHLFGREVVRRSKLTK